MNRHTELPEWDINEQEITYDIPLHGCNNGVFFDGHIPATVAEIATALQEKAERDKMQCVNCHLKDTELCRAVWKTKYDIKKEKWKCKTMMEDDGFCSRFEPKEELLV